jgi:hypothetical protein
MRLVTIALLVGCGSDAAQTPSDAGTDAPIDAPAIDPDDHRTPLTMRIHAVRTADDGGGRAANITADQVVDWLAEANRVFAAARVRFEFDPVADFETLNNTLLNTLDNSGANFGDQIVAGNAIAAQHPGEAVVFFRHGSGAGPTGNGFSYHDIDFIAMPGFNDTGVCGHQNLTIFAHELGHYLGLNHSFDHVDATDADALAALQAAGGSLSAFEGDGIQDNGVDPYIETHQCDGDAAAAVTVGTTRIPIGRDDIMSYYDSTHKTLSRQQGDVVRQVLSIRRGLGASAVLEDASAATTIEGETLIAAGTFAQNMAPFGGKWSGGSQLFWTGGNAAQLDVTLPTPPTGAFRLYGIFTAAPDFGRVAVRVNGSIALAQLDLYGGAVQHRGPVDLGVWIGAGATVTLSVIGKNDRSSGFLAGIDAFVIVPE